MKGVERPETSSGMCTDCTEQSATSRAFAASDLGVPQCTACDAGPSAYVLPNYGTPYGSLRSTFSAQVHLTNPNSALTSPITVLLLCQVSTH